MRLALLLALMNGGCNPFCDEITGYRSSPTHEGIAIAGSEQLIAVSWSEQVGVQSEFRVSTLTASGTVTAFVPEALFVGNAGTTTSVWGSEGTPSSLQLVSADQSVPVEVAPDATRSVVVFDGAAYQVFWQVANRWFHRTLHEDGTLGPEHGLALQAGIDLEPFTDRAGTTFLALDSPTSRTIARIDTDTGSQQPVWTAPNAGRSYDQSFWFADGIHVRWQDSSPHIDSIDPITGMSRTRDLPLELSTGHFHPTTDVIVVHAVDAFLEVDRDFRVTHGVQTEGPTPPPSAAGSSWVYVDSIALDENTLTPGRLEVVQRHGESEMRDELVVDGDVTVFEECGHRSNGCSNAGDAGIATAAGVLLLSCRRRRRR